MPATNGDRGVLNFYAGPTALPWPVIERMRADIADFHGSAPGEPVDYANTGYWARKSIAEPRRMGRTSRLWPRRPAVPTAGGQERSRDE